MPSHQQDYYAALHLKPTASKSEVHSAFRRLALLCHPDKGGDASTFRAVREAYEELSDLQRRRRYDRKHNSEGVHGDELAKPTTEDFMEKFEDVMKKFEENIHEVREELRNFRKSLTEELKDFRPCRCAHNPGRQAMSLCGRRDSWSGDVYSTSAQANDSAEKRREGMLGLRNRR